MPVRSLPTAPSLDHLKHQAKDLLKLHAQHDPTTAQRLREFHPRFAGATDPTIFAATLRLTDAQLTIAREHGFPSWPRLKAHIEKPTRANRLDLPHHERIEDPIFRRAVDLIDNGDAPGLRLHLAHHPNLIRQHVLFEGGNYFRDPTLLEFIAENPIRHNQLPPNIIEIARILLERHPARASINQTLALVVSGSVVAASGHQRPLIALLCHRGASPDDALHTAALHGEHTAVQALLDEGARLTLPVAAALDRMDDFLRLLPTSTSEDRHLALAMSTQFNRFEITTLLLDAGEDPNRFHPVGGHSHGTPLHQAAGHGYESIVRLLVERGARTDLRDVLWHATPAEWAAHEGKTTIAAYLKAHS